ncbi:MAG: methylmalonyl-CoA mutase family protein [Planctomycetota bacterium]|jgi:methylmalonyl-CoA mutase
MTGSGDPQLQDQPQDHDLDLRADFPPPTVAEWQAQVRRDLQNRRYQDLFWHTDEGFVVEPLATQEDLEGIPHLRPEATGIAALLRPPRPWAIRERVAAGDPARAGELARAAVEGGAEELLVVLDLLGQLGLEPLAPTQSADMASHMAGSAGIALCHQEDMAVVLAGVDIAKVPLAIEARSSGLVVLAFLLNEAKRRGIDPSQLRVDLGLDPLHETLFLEPAGSGPEHLLRECSNALAFCAEQAPGIRPIGIHSHEYHRCGASVVQELGCVLAGAIEYLRFLLAQNHPLDRVLNGMGVRMQVGNDLYLEIAKLRALRLLWAKVARAFGASSVEQLRVPVHAESSERARAVWRDTRGNLLRTTVQAFAATIGGCDSLTIGAYDMNRTTARGSSVALARKQQLLLREESHLHRVADPVAGSHALELLTHKVADAAWAFVQEIESRDGILKTIESGWLAEVIATAASQRADSFRTRKRVMVGISRYVDPVLEAEEEAASEAPDEPSHGYLHARLEEWKANQDRVAIGRSTKQLNSATGPALISATAAVAAAGASLGELVSALRGAEVISIARNFNDYTGTDGLEFESLRNPTVEIPVLMVATGTTPAVAERAKLATDVFTVGGFRVINAGRHDTPEAMLAALRKHDCIFTIHILDFEEDFQVQTRLVCICADDDAYPQVLAALASAQTDRDTMFFVVSPPRPGLDKHLDSFIYEGMDVAEFLEDLLQQVYRTPWARWCAERQQHPGVESREDPNGPHGSKGSNGSNGPDGSSGRNGPRSPRDPEDLEGSI